MIYTASLVDYFPWVIWSCFFHYSVNCMNDTRNPLHVESTVETYNCKRGAITGMTNTTVYTNSTYNESESLVPIKPSKSLSYFTSWILIFIVKTACSIFPLPNLFICIPVYMYIGTDFVEIFIDTDVLHTPKSKYCPCTLSSAYLIAIK